MSSTSATEEFCLDHNRPLSLRKTHGAWVVCLSGTIWITANGELEDRFLTAGQRHRIGNNGLTIVESIGSGCIRLERQQARLPRWLAGLSRLLALRKAWPRRLGV